MTDVWTSAGVIAGIGAVAGDRVGVGSTRSSRSRWRSRSSGPARSSSAARALGLLDRALPADEQEAVDAVLARHAAAAEVQFHAVRTRQAGARRFVTLHVLVPGDWTVAARARAAASSSSSDVREAIPDASVVTHLEALDDPASFEDQELDRVAPPARPPTADRVVRDGHGRSA